MSEKELFVFFFSSWYFFIVLHIFVRNLFVLFIHDSIKSYSLTYDIFVLKMYEYVIYSTYDHRNRIYVLFIYFYSHIHYYLHTPSHKLLCTMTLFTNPVPRIVTYLVLANSLVLSGNRPAV